MVTFRLFGRLYSIKGSEKLKSDIEKTKIEMRIIEDSKFIILKGRNKQFYFDMKARNGEKVLRSEDHETNCNCRKAIAFVRENSPYDNRYARRLAPNKQHYFILTKANGQALGISVMYDTVISREEGITMVKRDALTAEIKDHSHDSI